MKQSETVTDRDTYGFQLLSLTLYIHLHHPSQNSPPGFLPQMGNLYTSIACTAPTFLLLWCALCMQTVVCALDKTDMISEG